MVNEEETVLEKLEPQAKLWLELNGEHILGRGGALLLRGIVEKGSISQALKALPKDTLGEIDSPSYRFAWGYLQKMEERIGAPIVEKRRGHSDGKGGTALTQLGLKLLDLYESYEKKLTQLLSTKS
ncbi:MAG: winged helix-turn-helix domain-containing protein [Candidatus Thorarchaeota archaeon]